MNKIQSKHVGFHNSLYRTLLIWFLLLALLPMILIAWISYQQGYKTLKEEAANQLEQASQANSRFIHNWFDYRFKDSIVHAANSNTQALFSHIQSGWQQSGQSLKKYISSDAWVQTVYNSDDEMLARIQHYDYIYDLFLIDLAGNIVYTVKHESDLGENLFTGTLRNSRFSKATKASLKSGQPLFSGLEYYLPSNNILAGFITTPIYNKLGEIIGVLAVQLRMEKFFSVIEGRVQSYHPMIRYVVDDKGELNVILDKNINDMVVTEQRSSLVHYVVGSDRLLRTVLNDNSSEVLSRAIDTEPVKLWELENAELESGVGSMKESAFEYRGPDGQQVIGIHHAVHLPGVEWLLISEINRDEILAPADWLKEVTLALLLLTGLSVTGLASFQARRITKPIKDLVKATRAVGKGDLKKRVIILGNNEISMLSESFNNMLDIRQQQWDALQESNVVAQQALAEVTEQKFALDQHAIVSITDVDGRIVLVNDNFCDISGYSSDELIGADHRLLNSGQHDNHFFDAMYSTLVAGEVWHGEICNKSKNGQLYWVDSTIVPIKRGGGKPQGYIAIRTDITVIKKAELVLQENKERLELVMTSTGVGIWDWHLLSGEITFNERWAAITGYTLDELRPFSKSTWVNMVHPDDMLRSTQIMKRHFNGEFEIYECELRLRHKDGHWLWVLDSGQLVERDKNGSPSRMIGTLLDISRLKQAEVLQQEIEQRFMRLFQSSGDAMFLLGDEGFIASNTAAAKLFGYTNEEQLMLCKPSALSPLIQPDGYNSAAKEKIMMDVVYERGVNRFEWMYQKKNGEDFLVEVSLALTPILITGKTVIQCILRDLTQIKQAEAALIKAKDAAEAASIAKGDFLANMSHEIRTPMNGVLGMTELLLSNPLDTEQQNRANTIKRSAESLLTIINDILDFSKVESGKLDMEILDFELGQLIEDVADTLALSAAEKGLEFICAVNPAISQWYKGDVGRVRQVLTNLVSNAIKFTEHGEVSVHYETRVSKDGRTKLYFTVTDSGIGLDLEQQQKLFQKFSQADNSTTRKFGGTGLGLAICKALVEIMGGEIGVESVLGKGSVFWFTLDLEVVEPGTSPVEVKKFPGERILVVDDNITSRQVFGGFLSAWEIPHQLVAGANDALLAMHEAKKNNKPYSIVLIDMLMPEIDGIELADVIRREQAFSSTRLGLLATQGQVHDAEKMYKQGFSIILNKPVRQAELYNAILQLAGLNLENKGDKLIAVDDKIEKTKVSFQARALVVDDNSVNQAVARGMLKKLGVDVDVAADGQEAVDMLVQFPYDLVFMDCQMPIMDGYEATQHVRDPQTPVLNHHIPIIAMTANAMQGDKEKCFSAGMDDFIAKPVDMIKLRGLLEKWLVKEQVDKEPLAQEESVSVNSVSDDQIFDYQALSKRLMDDKELIEVIADAFLADMPIQINQINTLVANGDISSVTAQAHKIKGASANVGARQLTELALEMEKSGKAEDLDAIKEKLTVLDQYFEQLKSMMKKALL